MSSRSLRRSVAILGFAALLLPAAGLQAAQSRHLPPATQTAPHQHPVIEFLLHLISGIGSRIDAGCPIDGNG
ncbi:MAG TPA: hypothetical protein VHG32_09720 [Thermoanaerobaculia bacterium]|jgi:hypothetical protein|nr:hypothetical protein [Thermoanaerobaculia bacterium]